MKNKILISLIYLITTSCVHENTPVIKDNINMQETMYSINLVQGNNSLYISIESDNDTVYVNKFTDSIKDSFKMKVREEIINKIKSNVLYHIQTNNFFNKRIETLHGNKVRFSLSQYNNKIEATYVSLNNYKDVSNKLDSLISFLKNEDRRINEF